jgi:hypothetical protein
LKGFPKVNKMSAKMRAFLLQPNNLTLVVWNCESYFSTSLEAMELSVPDEIDSEICPVNGGDSLPTPILTELHEGLICPTLNSTR